MLLYDLITIDPKIADGSPVFGNNHVPIQSLFYYIAAGNSIDQYLKDFPGVKKEEAVKLLEIAGRELNKICLVSARILRKEDE